MDEREARMALSCVVEGGTPAVADAVSEYGAAEVWRALTSGKADSAAARRARGLDLDRVQALAAKDGQRFVIPGDQEWPEGLGDLYGCEQVNRMSGVPVGLWVRGAGHLGELTRACVAVVGSRASTPYGEAVAADLAVSVGEAGFTVVSGGAFGIDAAAHRGALASRTPTIAVGAGGLDQPYPPGHRALFERIAERGVLVSELPPEEHPTRVRFLGRNRLIAAMTPGALMVEAAVRSGARNTVTWATVLHRVVMAVPGPVTSANSVTPHRLIRDGEAVLVTRGAEILELLSPLGRPTARPPSDHRRVDELDAEELAVYEAIPGRGALSAAEVSLRAGRPVSRCLAILDELERRGFVAMNGRLEWQLPPRASRGESCRPGA